MVPPHSEQQQQQQKLPTPTGSFWNHRAEERGERRPLISAFET